MPVMGDRKRWVHKYGTGHGLVEDRSVDPLLFPSLMSLITLPPLICAVLAAVLFKLWRAVVRVQYNSLRHLPGPESPSVLFGFAWQFWSADPTELHEEWVRLYGRTMSYRILSDICLFTMDTKALAHILTHDATYQKPYAVRTFIAEMLGTGMFALSMITGAV